MAGIHWPKSPLADALIRGGPQSDKLEWPIGVNIIHDDGADRVLFWARLPFILLGALLGWLIYWWGRELVGSAAALAALFFYAFDPDDGGALGVGHYRRRRDRHSRSYFYLLCGAISTSRLASI
jgi:hypothetical protein